MGDVIGLWAGCWRAQKAAGLRERMSCGGDLEMLMLKSVRKAGRCSVSLATEDRHVVVARRKEHLNRDPKDRHMDAACRTVQKPFASDDDLAMG